MAKSLYLRGVRLSNTEEERFRNGDRSLVENLPLELIPISSGETTIPEAPEGSLQVNSNPISGDCSDPFDLSYYLRVCAEDQAYADGATVTNLRAAVGPAPEIQSGTVTMAATGFGGQKCLQLNYSPASVIRQALPSVFSPEKPFAMFFYCTIGTTNVTSYLGGFANAGGNQRLSILYNNSQPSQLIFDALSTAEDVIPINQIQRVGNNLYQGRRWNRTERTLIGVGYDGTKWYAFWNGMRMALSSGYGYVTRTASAIAHDGYLYFNGAGGLAYPNNPKLREFALIDHCPTDYEVAQYFRSVAVSGETSVFAYGDSLTDGSGATTDGVTGTKNGYPQQLQELVTSRIVTCWGKVGDTTIDMLRRLSQVRYYLPRNRGKYCVLILAAGTNDLLITTDTADQIYARIVSICLAAKSYGCGTVVVSTVLPSTGISGGRETQRVALNALIKSGAGSAYTVASDSAARTNLSNASNGTYFSDGTHLTDAGYADYAAGFNQTLVSLGL